MPTTTVVEPRYAGSRACFVSTTSPAASNRRSRIGSDVASTPISRISADCSGSTTSTRCTATTRAPAAIRRRTASATRSRLRLASTTTGSSVRIASGPRNQRRSPLVINTAFYPKLMWNGRFFANPAPGQEARRSVQQHVRVHVPGTRSASLSYHDHLLQAQAFIPPTELVEVAGFTGTSGTDLSPRFRDVRQRQGTCRCRCADESGFRNHPIRMEVIEILNATPGYRLAFGKVFPEVRHGAPITFDMFGRAIAEFEFTLTFATAPIDRFARGQQNAMTDAEKRGALVFFGEGKCITCHATKGKSNEMFSDFENHVAGIPQLAPRVRRRTSNMIYDGPGEDEDFGAMQISGDPADKYKFRTAPLRNIALVAGVLPQRRVCEARRCDSLPPRSDAALQPGERPASIRISTRRMGPRIDESYLHPLFKNGGIDLSEAADSRRHAVRQDRAARSAREEREPLRPDSEVGAQQAEGADIRGVREQTGQERRTRRLPHGGIRDWRFPLYASSSISPNPPSLPQPAMY